MSPENDHEKNIKEDFCPACAAIPLAMLGAGASAGNSKYNKNYRKYKNLICIFSLITTFIALFIGIYFLFIKKDCNQCIAE
jgi:hypothetical protein